jgi:hypothetical protein
MTVSGNDKKKMLEAMRKMSDCWSEMEAARDTVKGIVKELCEELEIPRKEFTKCAKVFHKQNFNEEDESHELFKSMYKALVSK